MCSNPSAAFTRSKGLPTVYRCTGELIMPGGVKDEMKEEDEGEEEEEEEEADVKYDTFCNLACTSHTRLTACILRH